MTNSYDDITEKELLVKKKLLDIPVKVVQARPSNVSKRAVELTVEVLYGSQFPLIFWTKSNQGRKYEWQEGHWYFFWNVHWARFGEPGRNSTERSS